MKPIISVEGLGKSYTIRHEGQTRYKSLREEIFKLPKRLLSRGGQSQEEFWALKDVNFDIMPGDRVGIIGRNGAGKSTLLKLLSRITEPTTGRITLRGRVASLLEVGTGFHPELTGRENIFLNGAILGMSRAEVRRKFDEIVDFAGVEKFLDTPVKRYSSGMYVRLAFAVAAHLEPEILIVDEVLAVGDAEFQEKCLGKMESVGKEGRTVLFVSHNIGAVQHLCSKGLLFESGSLRLADEVDRVIKQYIGFTALENSSSGEVNLAELGRKRGLARRLFQRITVKDSAGNVSNVVECGGSIKFEIEVNDVDKIKNTHIGISLFNSSGVCVANVSTWQFYKTIPVDSQQDACIIFNIDDVRLVPGSYSISIFSSTRDTFERVDIEEDFMAVKIVEGVHANGILSYPESGLVLLDASCSAR